MNTNRPKGPRFVRYFQPLIAALIELGGSGRPEEVEDILADQLGLSEEERNEQIPSGQSRFSNRVAWVRFYLVRAGLIDSSTRGVWSLTERGRTTSLDPENAVALFNLIHKQFSAEKRKPKAEKPVEEDLPSPEIIDHRSALMNILNEMPGNGFRTFVSAIVAGIWF